MRRRSPDFPDETLLPGFLARRPTPRYRARTGRDPHLGYRQEKKLIAALTAIAAASEHRLSSAAVARIRFC